MCLATPLSGKDVRVLVCGNRIAASIVPFRCIVFALGGCSIGSRRMHRLGSVAGAGWYPNCCRIDGAVAARARWQHSTVRARCAPALGIDYRRWRQSQRENQYYVPPALSLPLVTFDAKLSPHVRKPGSSRGARSFLDSSIRERFSESHRHPRRIRMFVCVHCCRAFAAIAFSLSPPRHSQQ